MENNSVVLEWYRNKNIILYKGIICLTDTGDYETYEPQKYINGFVPSDIVNDILGEKTLSQQPFNLITLLLSLDIKNDEQILRWIKYFGFLNNNSYITMITTDDAEDIETLRESEYNDLVDYAPELFNDDGYTMNSKILPLVSIKDIKEEIYILQLLSELFNAVLNNDSNDSDIYFNKILNSQTMLFNYGLNDYIHYKYYPKYPVNGYEIINSWDIDKIKNLSVKEFRDLCKSISVCRSKNLLRMFFKEYGSKLFVETVQFIMKSKLNFVIPSFEFENNKFSFVYNYSTLKDSLYYLLAMYSSEGIAIQKCRSKTCNNYFIQSRFNQIYCSDVCKNRAKQQRFRNKKEK